MCLNSALDARESMYAVRMIVDESSIVECGLYRRIFPCRGHGVDGSLDAGPKASTEWTYKLVQLLT